MPGSRSPLAAVTLAQARALERELARSGAPLPVFVGMRNWHPFLHETLADMTARGVKRALGIILSPLRTEASWERYQQDVTDARAKVGGAPEVTFARAWYDHPRFIEAVEHGEQRAAPGELPLQRACLGERERAERRAAPGHPLIVARHLLETLGRDTSAARDDLEEGPDLAGRRGAAERDQEDRVDGRRTHRTRRSDSSWTISTSARTCSTGVTGRTP